MAQNIFKYLFILISLGLLASCAHDEFLIENDPNLLSSETYWRNLNDTKSGLTATYASLLNHFVTNMAAESCRADMGYPGYGRPVPAGAGPVDWYYHTYSNTTEEVEKKWQALYLGIFRSNQVIEGLEGIQETMATEDDRNEWSQQMGEARFLRGLFHFYLYHTYNEGSVIIRDKVPVTQKDFNKGLSPSSEVLDFVREDFRYAYENLPSKYTETADKGRVTAGAAATLLGNSFLFEGEYDLAMAYFDDVITNQDFGYKLVADKDLMFTLAGELNDESILEICYNTVYRPELNVWDEESLFTRWANISLSHLGNLSPAWLNYAYKSEELDPLDARNYYSDEANPDSSLLRNVSLRASAMIVLVEDEQTKIFGTSTSDYPRFAFNNHGFGGSKKFANHELDSETEGGTTAWQSGKNFTLNRLAEVYINMAECVIKTDGNLEVALDYINAIRKRWGLVLLGQSNGDFSHSYDGINYTREQLMEHIMYVEKPLELSNEGHMIRWIDMRRWDIIDQRLNQLSNQTYYAINYSYINADGVSKQRSRASIVTEIPDGYTGDIAIIDYEYKLSAQNYKSEVHDYFKIPSNETVANPNVNK